MKTEKRIQEELDTLEDAMYEEYNNDCGLVSRYLSRCHEMKGQIDILKWVLDDKA